MRAAVLRHSGEPLEIEAVGIDCPRPHEIRARTVASGVCHSDLSVADGRLPGRFPVILGHEVAGVVDAVGSAVQRIAVGDSIVTSPFGYCGACYDCMQGRISVCAFPGTRRPRGASPRVWVEDSEEGRSIHAFSDVGGFSSEILVHERQCVAIRSDIPLDRAAILGCAVVTGIGAVMHSAKLRPGESIAIIGCGGIGLAAIQGARIAGADRIIAIDRSPAALALALRVGATDILNSQDMPPVEAVLELTLGGVHHCLEAVGSVATIAQAFAMVRRGGVATVVGLPPTGANLELDPSGFGLERRLQGSLMGSNNFPVDIPKYVDWYSCGRLDLDSLIAQRITLDQVNDAFDDLRAGRSVGRIVIEFSQ